MLTADHHRDAVPQRLRDQEPRPVLNWGVDFRGGSEIVIEFSQARSTSADVRKALGESRLPRRRGRQVRRPDRAEEVELHGPRGRGVGRLRAAGQADPRVAGQGSATPRSSASSGRRAATRSTCATTRRSSRRCSANSLKAIGVNTTQVQAFGRPEDHTYEVTLVGLDTEIRRRAGGQAGRGRGDGDPAGRVGRRQGGQPAAGRRHQVAALRDPADHGLRRLPVRPPLRPGHGRRAAPRRDPHHRRLRRHLQGVLADDGGGGADHHRLLDERHHRRVRPHPRERRASCATAASTGSSTSRSTRRCRAPS